MGGGPKKNSYEFDVNPKMTLHSAHMNKDILKTDMVYMYE